ncbi:MAG TPA: ABC transporter permease [Candidatus Angelobacter sp.]|jgi:predicted permease|nr:ABC transporter permease [Candidatus Angelobacter sp.]
MKILNSLRSSLATLFHRPQMDAEMEEELRSHIKKRADDLENSGIPRPEAIRRARIEFGGLERSKEECRQKRGGPWLETFWTDVRYGLRMFHRSPGFTTVAVLTLALGIGANTAIFSVVQGVMLAPLPYYQPDRLVIVWQNNAQTPRLSVSLPDFEEWQRHASSFEQMAGVRWYSFNLTSPGPPEHSTGFEVSSGFFHMLGVQLSLGREFTPQEDQAGAARVAIINHRLWKARFGGDPQAVGKSVTLDGVSYTIVGILPPEFHFVDDRDVYIPLRQADPMFNDRRFPGVLPVGRLKPGVNASRAHSEMDSIQANLNQLYPDTDRGFGTVIVPLKPAVVGDIAGTLLLILGAVAVVLLIACANVANLLLARSAARTREFAVRSALGANQARIVRQLVTESVLLALAGGILGLAVAKGALRGVLAIVATELPRSENVGLNGPVLLFALVVSLMVGVLFGLAPALKSLKLDLYSALKKGARGSNGAHHRTQNVLVIGQMALTVVLLAGAGLLFRTIRDLWQLNPGFEAKNVITFKVGLSPSVTKSASTMRTAYRQLLERIRSIPGVESADITNLVPLNHSNNPAPFWVGTRATTALAEAPRLFMYWTGPDYLKTMKIPLLQGRYLTPEDNENSERVTVIDSVLARIYFPDQNPVGQSITVNIWGDARIVGVVAHVQHKGLGDPEEATEPHTYASLEQLPPQAIKIFYSDLLTVVRTPLAPATVMPAIKAAVYSADSDQPVYAIRTMQEIVSDSLTSQRFPMLLLSAFAVLALVLASVGIYGVISYAMTQRVSEIGIRIALGAKKSGIFRMVLAQGLRLAVIGLAIGAMAALILGRVLGNFSHLLYGVGVADPLTFATVTVVLISIALIACYVPARRAMATDPMIALRHE